MGQKGTERVREALAAAGVDVHVQTLPTSTRTAQEAAETIGCTVAEIAKSLVFKGRESDKIVLAIMCGTNRAEIGKLSALAGETVKQADPNFVKAVTGFAIGGVPPVGLSGEISIYLDEDLLQFATIWAAAGGPHDVFSIAPQTLIEVSGATVASLKE